MEKKQTIKYFIPLIILVLILIAGIYYWQKNKKDSDTPTDSVKTQSSGNVAGISLEGTGDYPATDLEKNQGVITDGNTYQYMLSEIRKPVNDALYDLIDKSKYQNKFNKDDVLNAARIAQGKCEEGKRAIEELKIDAKFKPYNQKHIQAVQYLIEAIDALDQLYATGENKYADEFSLKIDYSNREINNLNIPQ